MDKPMCKKCGIRTVTKKQTGKWRTVCWQCYRPDKNVSMANRKRNRERFYVPCAMCGKQPEHISDFEIDHIDGNRSNNTDSNKQSLCTPCHRAKSLAHREYLPKALRA